MNKEAMQSAPITSILMVSTRIILSIAIWVVIYKILSTPIGDYYYISSHFANSPLVFQWIISNEYPCPFFRYLKYLIAL